MLHISPSDRSRPKSRVARRVLWIRGILRAASGTSMIHDPCTLLCDDNLQCLQPSSGLDSRHRPNAFFFSCFAFASVSVTGMTGEWERESARGKGDQTQRCSREGGRGGEAHPGIRDVEILSHPFLDSTSSSLPGACVTHTPELGVSHRGHREISAIPISPRLCI